MVETLDLDCIKRILTKTDIIQLIEDGFIAYSKGNVVIPPVGEMSFLQLEK